MVAVGDWLEARHGTINNDLWNTGYGCFARAAWTWQWNRDGTPISGATDYRYQVQPADSGAVITVTTTPVDLMGRETNPVTSDATDPVTS